MAAKKPRKSVRGAAIAKAKAAGKDMKALFRKLDSSPKTRKGK